MSTEIQQAKNTRTSSRWLRHAGAIAGLALTLAAGSAQAQDAYPNHAIRIIVPFAAGGPSDTTARIAAQMMTRYIHQTVYIENRTGGGGVVGAEAAAAAPADGYTLLLTDAASFIVTPIVHKVSYDVERDFVGLGQIAAAPQVLVVNPKSRFKSAKALVDYAKANPNKVSFGSAGVGTTTHLSIMLLQKDASVSLVHAPYRGTSLSVADVMSGTIDAIFGDIGTLVPNIQAGELLALATTGDTRSPLLPDVPTMVELGYPGVRMVNWFGLHVRSNTPPAIQQRLKDAVRAVQEDSEFADNLRKRQMASGTVGADSFNKMVKDTSDRLGPVVRSLGQID